MGGIVQFWARQEIRYLLADRRTMAINVRLVSSAERRPPYERVPIHLRPNKRRVGRAFLRAGNAPRYVHVSRVRTQHNTFKYAHNTSITKSRTRSPGASACAPSSSSRFFLQLAVRALIFAEDRRHKIRTKLIRQLDAPINTFRLLQSVLQLNGKARTSRANLVSARKRQRMRRGVRRVRVIYPRKGLLISCQ